MRPASFSGAAALSAARAAAPMPNTPVSSTSPRCSRVRLSGDFETASIALPPFVAVLHGDQKTQGEQPAHRALGSLLEHVRIDRAILERRERLPDRAASVAEAQQLDGRGVHRPAEGYALRE